MKVRSTNGLTIRRRQNTCWMRLDSPIPMATGRGLDSSSLLKARISICGEELPKLSKNSCSASASTWKSATYEWGTFFSDIKKGNFHLYSLAWVGIQDPDIHYQIFHSSSFPPNGDNRGHYSNSQVDRLLEEGRMTMDPTERKRIYAEVQRILAEISPTSPCGGGKT